MNASVLNSRGSAISARQRRHHRGLRMDRAPDVDRLVDERHVRLPKIAIAAASFSDPGPPYFRTSR